MNMRNIYPNLDKERKGEKIMKKLIINADDFGLADGCNRGIIDAMKNGIVTSTTVMINMPKAVEAIDLAKKVGIKEMGVHLTLTCGKPLLSKEEVPSLVDENGRFYRRVAKLLPLVNLEEVEKELRAQIDEFLKTGLKLTHLDSHHHVHMYDGIKEIVSKLAKEYCVSVRHPDEKTKEYLSKLGIRTTDFFSMNFYGKDATLENLKRIIKQFPEGTIEIMTHPAYVDEKLKNISSYNVNRAKELEILTSVEIKEWIEKEGIKLINFDGLEV